MGLPLMTANVRSSYTAASAAPVKLYRDIELLRSIADGRILPRHVQLSVTNRCNLKCPWCSCSEREMRDELPLDVLLRLVDDMEDLGTRGITITGGGEPLLHPGINELVGALQMAGIDIGLVSNGLEVRKLAPKQVRALTWARISFSDSRDWSRPFEQALEYLEGEGCQGLAFSYVLTNEPRAENLVRVVRRAIEHDYTHVRVVDDILNPSDAAMARARQILEQSGLPLDRVIFQPRSEYTHGDKRCLLSLLKPMISADGFIYPCCGCQYAITGDTRGFPVRMRMGGIADFRSIVEGQRYFDGSICDVCYYGAYLKALADLTAPLEHLNFV